jgi:transposase
MDGRDLKLYNERTMEVQFLRRESQWLRGDRDYLRVQLFRADRQFAQLQEQNERLARENAALARRVDELTAGLRHGPGEEATESSPPPFVRPNVPDRPRKRPGRKRGHPAALRPVPAEVDVRKDVPLPTDAAGRPCCPHCNCSLCDLRRHEQLVEDIVPAKVLVTRYRTRSGWCAMCRRRVESRAPEQPPRAGVPHGQLGVNALATAAVLRVVHRLPLRQVAGVLADLPGLTVSPGGISRQLRRLAGWLDPYYERVLLALRSAPRVHADETGWRTDGRNGYLWAITDPGHTLYHVDESRSGKVIRGLLGEAFGGTVVSDFYAAYDQLDCPKQRCLAHLLRELKETAQKHPAFAAGDFGRKAGRLVKDALALKRRWDDLSDEAYTTRVCRLEGRLQRLAAVAYDEPHAARLAKRLLRYQKELTAFLWEKDLDGTNNAAERALRPAVVMRKITGGSRSKAGAQAWAKLASLMRTAGQQGRNVLEVVKQLLMEHWAGHPAMALTSGP